jgi:uncharacterized protein YciI
VYLMMSTYLVPLDEVDKVRDEHLVYVDDLLERGLALAGGRQEPAVGGILLLNVADEDQAREVIAQDPYVRHGVAEYRPVGWQPTRGVLKDYVRP